MDPLIIMFDKFPYWELVAFAVLFLFIAQFFRTCLFRSSPSPRLPPGPKGWPIVGALPFLGTKPHRTLTKMAERYGPVMYLKMGTAGIVVASTPHAAQVFLKDLDSSFSNRPQTLAARVIYDAQDIVFGEYGPTWKLMKKLSSIHLFGGKAMEDWNCVREREVRHTLKAIYASSSRGRPLALAELLSCTFSNIIGQMVLSRRMFDPEQSESSNEFKYLVENILKFLGLVNIGDYISYVAWMDLQRLGVGLKRIQKKFDTLLDTIIGEHVATAYQRIEKPDFLDILMDEKANLDNETLSSINIKAIIEDLFVAGTDTTTSTIVWALTELIKNPSILSRAREQMDCVVGRDRLLCESDLPKLPFLQAICKETLRLHPSIPMIYRASTEDGQVDGYDIPKGTTLIVNLWAMGRDPETWENPLEFMPERFLDSKEKGPGINPFGNDFRFIPFGSGRRICVGLRLVTVLSEYILGTLVHAFEWNLPDGINVDELNMDEVFGFSLQKIVPLSVLATPRLSPSAYVFDI